MSRLPKPGSDQNTWGDLLNDYLLVEHNLDGTLKKAGDIAAALSKADAAAVDSTVVHNVSDEVVKGVKTFFSSPIVPLPTTNTQAASKAYVDSTVSAGAPDASTTTKGIVKLAGDLSGTALLPTVPGLATKEPLITTGTTSQYYRGDKTFQTLDKSAVGLGNVDNTSDVNKPISTAQQTALDAKAIDSTVVHISSAETIGGVKTFSSSPVVPTPTNANEAANKSYVDSTSLKSLTVSSANGLAGTVANPTTNPAITLSTTVSGLVKANGTAFSSATPGTDYTTPSSTEAVTNKDFTSVTNTFPTFNQNTTGSAGLNVLKTGDTMSGLLTISSASNNSAIFINTSAPSTTGGAGAIMRSNSESQTNGTRLGYMLFGGLTTNAAGVVAYAAGTWSGSSKPSYFTFEVTAVGSTTRTTALTINADSTVVAAGKITAPALEANAATGNSFIADTSTLVVDATNHRVGIGTAAPTQLVDIQGDGNAQLLLKNITSATSSVSQSSPQIRMRGNIWNSSSGTKSMEAYLQVVALANNANPSVSKLSFLVATDANTPTEQMYISSAGTLGTSGGADFAAPTLSAANSVQIRNTEAATTGAVKHSNKLILEGRAWNSANGNSANQAYLQLLFSTNNANPFISRLGFFTQAGVFAGATTERLSIENTGNVGIGTTAPQTLLHISGASPAFRVQDITGGSASFYSHYGGAGQDIAQLSINRNPSTGVFVDTAKAGAQLSITSDTAANGGSYFQFYTSAANNTTPTEKMRITGAGSVGIGTTNPGKLLDVAGTLNVTGAANFVSTMTVGGLDNRGVLTVQKSDVTTFASNTDPTDPGRYFVMENVGSTNIANQYAAVTLQINPAAAIASGRVLGDIRLVRETLSQTNSFFVFSAFRQDTSYKDFAKIGYDASWFVGNLGVGTTSPSARLHVTSTLTSSSGVDYGAIIAPTITQTSTAGYTGLAVNVTETTTGSGSKNIVDFQVAGSSMAKIDTAGMVTARTFNQRYDQNALTSLAVTNSTSGTAARANIAVTAGANGLTIESYSGAFTGGGTDAAPDSGRLIHSGVGGFSFRAANAAASIRFYNGSTEAMRVDSTGRVGVGTTAPAATLHVGGSFATAFVSKSTAYTLTVSDHTVAANASSGAFSLTLPTAVGIAGTVYNLKKTDSSVNVVTVATTSSQIIDGVTTYTLATQWKYVTVQSDGANWLIISNN